MFRSFAKSDDAGRYSYGDPPSRHIPGNDCVGSDQSVIADQHAAENARSCADVHVPANNWHAGNRTTLTYRNLLKNKTIDSDARLWVNDNPVWMRE
jgi:hypothetical protein